MVSYADYCDTVDALDDVLSACCFIWDLHWLDDPAQFLLAQHAWAEILTYAGVPHSRVYECFQIVVLRRDPNIVLPVSVSELCAVWRELSAQEHPL